MNKKIMTMNALLAVNLIIFSNGFARQQAAESPAFAGAAGLRSVNDALANIQATAESWAAMCSDSCKPRAATQANWSKTLNATGFLTDAGFAEATAFSGNSLLLVNLPMADYALGYGPTITYTPSAPNQVLMCGLYSDKGRLYAPTALVGSDDVTMPVTMPRIQPNVPTRYSSQPILASGGPFPAGNYHLLCGAMATVDGTTYLPVSVEQGEVTINW